MGNDFSGAISAVLGCDLSGMMTEVRLSERREEKGDGFEGMWIGYCRGWVWEKCFTSDMGVTDRRCWRWDGLYWREGEFCLGGSSTCKAQSGWRWGWVDRVRWHWSSECGGPWTNVCMWGGVASLSRWCVGWSWGEMGFGPLCSFFSPFLSLSLFVSPWNHLKVKWECNWFYGWSGWFYSQQKWFSVWPNFLCATKHMVRCKMISWNAFQAK